MKYFICAISDYNSEKMKNLPVPMIDEDTNLPCVFDSYEEAEIFADNNFLCKSWGYEIIEWNY